MAFVTNLDRRLPLCSFPPTARLKWLKAGGQVVRRGGKRPWKAVTPSKRSKKVANCILTMQYITYSAIYRDSNFDLWVLLARAPRLKCAAFNFGLLGKLQKLETPSSQRPRRTTTPFFLTANKTNSANGFESDRTTPAARSHSVKVSGIHNSIRMIRLIRGYFST